MKLKKILLMGFKTFAEETVLEVGDGITAIVGPNGCGKSNILDAVRWVLGEKSARGLRGRNMEDVIFLGSEFRKPAGMAEVELTFDNQDRTLPIDQDEVLVGRRIYLNSGSEFLLNGKRTRRRDIERIFLDTGIGKVSYSIMEQGRISEILRATPEERRLLFDEAAGISRFKSNRKESMLQLDAVEQNFLRSDDILKSKESEIKNLERQAKRTRDYQQLKEKFDRHDRNLRFLKSKNLNKKSQVTTKRLEKLLKERDQIFKGISENEEQIEKMEISRNQYLEEMHRMDRDYHQALAAIDSISHNIERVDSEKKEVLIKFETLMNRKQSEESKKQKIKTNMDNSRQLELDLKTELKTLEKSGNILIAAMEKGRLEIKVSRELEQKIKVELIEIEKKQANLLEELKKAAQELINELEFHRKEWGGREKELIELKSNIETALQKIDSAIPEILDLMQSARSEEARSVLSKMKIKPIMDNFNKYAGIENKIRSFLFGERGLLSKKRILDEEMDTLQEYRESQRNEIENLIKMRQLKISELDKKNKQKTEIDLQIRDSLVRKENSIELRENARLQLAEATERIQYYAEELIKAEKMQRKAEEEVLLFKKELDTIKMHNTKQMAKIEGIKKQVSDLKEKIDEMKANSRKNRNNIEELLPQISEQERLTEGNSLARDALEENLYNDFQINLTDLNKLCENKNLIQDKEEVEYRQLKKEIENLGQFNPLAIEELESCMEAYNEVIAQRKDILKAKENIVKILKDIDSKSEELFLDTFQRIQNNFSEVFQTLFGGGHATLDLLDPENPLNSGVDIMAQPPGKKNTTLSLLSGGEQNMTAIALMFATYLVRPSPFCFLDEIDAPLDDNNVARFLRILSGFAARSQFLVITHNKLTMAKAECIFGVTQEDPGVSKMVSVKLKGREVSSR